MGAEKANKRTSYLPHVAQDKRKEEEKKRLFHLDRQAKQVNSLITVRTMNASDFNIFRQKIDKDAVSDKYFVTFKKPVPVLEVGRLIEESCSALAVKYCT